MKGNFHVQFLGEGVAATSPPYPTPGWATTQVYPAHRLVTPPAGTPPAGALEFSPKPAQVLIELLRKSQELLPSVLERPRNRFQPMRAQGDPGQKLGRHEVVQQTALGVGWLGHTEDVLAKSFQQHGIVAEAWRDIVVY